METLYPREIFKEGVFFRDNMRCVFCKAEAVDAHHIMDRKLFTAPEEAGGYFLNNGASVCNPCHMKCETTEYSVELVRLKCGIIVPKLPIGFDPSKTYNKWGDILLSNGYRVKGPLFEDTAVQKLFKKDLWLYVDSEDDL